MSKWEKVRLGDVCEKSIATLNSKASFDIDYIDIGSVDNVTKMITGFTTVDAPNAPSRAKQIIQLNDILISTVRPNLNAVAILNKATENMTVCSTGFCVLRCKDSILPNYLLHFSKSSPFIDYLVSKATGASYPAVNGTIVKDTKIPLPPLAEQQKIADTLDKVSHLIALRKEQLSKLDLLVKAKFVEMFGDPVENPMGWEKVAIGDVCHSIVDCVNKTAPYVEYVTDYKMLRTTNVKSGYIDTKNVRYVTEDIYAKWTSRSKPQYDDLILTREAPMGEVGRVTTDEFLFLGQRLVSYKCDQSIIAPVYLCRLIMSRFFQLQIENLGVGSTVKHLSVPDCKKFIVLLPPIALQTQFADYVTQVETSKQQIQQGLEKLETLYQGLMQEYFE